ncbi:diacylglycerol kinase [Tianweitania sp.]|uniref:diacylglycerol kinase n=1 Tax=Tianweitania sp. TaxID=2021634 RepID=UPI00289F7274|nr:diacylglycerol kinase [Tianweitania sp.]
MTRQPEDLPAKPLPKRGLPHVLAAATYSLGGFRRLLDETAFRHEIGACLAVLSLFAAVGVPAWHYAAQAILFLILFAIEALNTAIEVLVDEISSGYAEFARHAKDLGSFAVCCLLTANGIHAAGAVFLT